MMTNRKEFTDSTRTTRFHLAGGLCQQCTRKVGHGTKLKPEYDHIQACVFEGDNSLENCRLLCHECHKPKTASDVKSLAKVKRVEKRTAGIEKPKARWGKATMNKRYEPRVRQVYGDIND